MLFLTHALYYVQTSQLSFLVLHTSQLSFLSYMPLSYPYWFYISPSYHSWSYIPPSYPFWSYLPPSYPSWSYIPHRRAISLTSVVCKTMERLVKGRLITHLEMNNLIGDSQHGFRNKRSCLTSLLDFFA